MNLWQCFKRSVGELLTGKPVKLEPSIIVEVLTCDDIEVKCKCLCGKKVELVIAKCVFVGNFKRID